MRSLLIVDDEKNIRQGLKIMIEREYPGKYEIRLASSGQEALMLHHEQPADLIVTDIRMPVMDGFQLLEHLESQFMNAAGEKPVIVILSGYDEFDYAKTAIRYQVKEYMLKPIRREELFETLNRLEEEQSTSKAVRQQIAENDAYRRELQMSRLEQVLAGGTDSFRDQKELAEQTNFDLFELPYRVVVLGCQYDEGSWAAHAELSSLIRKLSVPGFRWNAELSDVKGQRVWITPNSEVLEAQLRCKEGLPEGLMIGISGEGRCLDELHTCYQQALEAQKYTRLPHYTACVSYDLIQQKQLNIEPIPFHDLRKLRNILGSDREKEIKELLQNLFHIDRLMKTPIEYLEGVSEQMKKLVLDDVFHTYGEASKEMFQVCRKVESLRNFRHFHQYFRTLEQLLLSLNEVVRQISSAHNGQADLRAAFDYIETNYHRPLLNMAMVSNHVSLSYSYFSEAFKAAAGDSFLNYLKKVRIHHAKERMGEWSLKLTEISLAVGFENTKQFTRVFKELEGITPQEYRAKQYAAFQARKTE